MIDSKPLGALFVDADSIGPSENGRQAWTTLFLMKDGDGTAGVTRGVAFLMTLDEYACAGGRADRSRHLYLQTYNQRGEPVERTPEPQPWEVVVPSSNADVEGRLVCDDEFRRHDQRINSGPLEMLKVLRRIGVQKAAASGSRVHSFSGTGTHR